MIHRYLDSLVNENKVDTLILGCTHYPLLRKVIRRELGEKINLVNPAYETALALKELLDSTNLAADDKNSASSSHEFYVSDGTEKFRQFAGEILSLDIPEVSLKVLE